MTSLLIFQLESHHNIRHNMTYFTDINVKVFSLKLHLFLIKLNLYIIEYINIKTIELSCTVIDGLM